MKKKSLQQKSGRQREGREKVESCIRLEKVESELQRGGGVEDGAESALLANTRSLDTHVKDHTACTQWKERSPDPEELLWARSGDVTRTVEERHGQAIWQM